MALTVEIGELTITAQGGNALFSAPLTVKDALGNVVRQSTEQIELDPNQLTASAQAVAYFKQQAGGVLGAAVAEMALRDKFKATRATAAGELAKL